MQASRLGLSARTGGQIAVDALVTLGVDRLFGVPAAQTAGIYRALRERRAAITHVLARHEQGAAFMAEGFARATGQVGVACVVTGVGLGNAVTPMASAMADSVPLLVVSSQVPSFWSALPARQYNHFVRRSSEGIAASVAKASFSITDAHEIAPTLHRAYELAQSQCPGPVHVEIPADILAATAGADGGCHEQVPVAANRKPAASVQAALAEAAVKLWHCQRPLIIAGGGAIPAAAQLAPLAEVLGAPVVTTIAGKGALDERHVLSLGTRLHILPYHEPSFRDADGLLLLGTQLSPVDWWLRAADMEVPLPAGARVTVQVDVDPATLADCERARPTGALTLEADARYACSALQEEFQRLLGRTGPPARWGGRAKELVQAAKAASDIPAALAATLGMDFDSADSAGEQMRATIRALHDALPPDACVVADLCRLSYLAWSLLPSYRPRSFLYPCGAGPLGFGLPGAIGAALARPGTPVVALLGDGGLQFSLPELAVAAEQQLPILLLLWNNRSLGEVRHHLGDGFANFDPAAALPDFGLLCAAYGLRHVRCLGAADVEQALRSAEVRRLLQGGGPPVMVEVLQP